MRAVTLLKDGKHESGLRVWADGSGRFRREYESGPAKGLVVLVGPEAVWRKEPGAAKWLKLPGRGRGVQEDFALLLRNYRVSLLCEEPLAGRRCKVIDFKSKHPGNPRKSLWIDTRTGLALRTDQYNSEGNLVSKSVFETVSFEAVDKAALFRPPASARVETPPLAESLRPLASIDAIVHVCGHRPGIPSTPPPGYELDGYFARTCRQNLTLPALRYFDGLNSIMVFERGERGRHGWGRGRGWQRHGGATIASFRKRRSRRWSGTGGVAAAISSSATMIGRDLSGWRSRFAESALDNSEYCSLEGQDTDLLPPYDGHRRQRERSKGRIPNCLTRAETGAVYSRPRCRASASSAFSVRVPETSPLCRPQAAHSSWCPGAVLQQPPALVALRTAFTMSVARAATTARLTRT